MTPLRVAPGARPWPANLLSLAAGALLATSFAPLGWWPFAVLAPATLMWLWQDTAPRRAAALGFWFNVGTFGAGTYWLYVSIHVFGQAPLWIAFALMAGLVAIMGAYHALLGYTQARWLGGIGAWRTLLVLPASWLFVEWWRGWFLSGFSWLSLGYSQTDTPLHAFAPVGGVYLVSFAVLVTSGALVTLLRGAKRERVVAFVVVAAFWGGAATLGPIEWTRASGDAVSVAIVQGAIPQDQKWLETNRATTLRLYRDLTYQQALGAKLIVWPESAPPDLANELVPYLGGIYRVASGRGSALVLGVVRASDDGERYFNSILAMDREIGWYDKRDLVPFAEFFPVPAFVRRWLRLMSLPYSDFTRGREDPQPLRAGGLSLAPTICYEDAYGSSQLAILREADALVNVTNDAWFGRSTARYQHLQISRMRAIEAGRYLVRAANDGVSAVIGPDGAVVAQAAEYQPTVLRASVVPRTGLPPYARVGNYPVVVFAFLVVLGAAAWSLRYGSPRRGRELTGGDRVYLDRDLSRRRS